MLPLDAKGQALTRQASTRRGKEWQQRDFSQGTGEMLCSPSTNQAQAVLSHSSLLHELSGVHGREKLHLESKKMHNFNMQFPNPGILRMTIHIVCKI